MPAAGESDASVPCCGMNGWQPRHSSRGQKSATVIREVEEQATHVSPRAQKTAPSGALLRGMLPDPWPAGTRWGVGRASGLLLPPILHCRSFETGKRRRRRRRRSARRCTRRRSGMLRRLLSKLGSCLRGTRGRRRRKRLSGSFPRAPLLGFFLLALFALGNMDVISTVLVLPGPWYFLGSTGGTVHVSVFGCLFRTLFPRAPCSVQAPFGV